MSQPTFDLQTALAAMADYPALLRRLGVIRVVEVDLAGSGIDPSKVGAVTVSAEPAWTTKLPVAQVHMAPVKVPAHLAPNRFALMADGRVDPAAAGIGVAEVDTDSGATRLVDLARQVVNAETANANPTYKDLPPVKLPDRLSLPSLRNAGLSIFQGDRAVDLRAQLVQGRGLLTAQNGQNLADPRAALKGLVVDVWDDRSRRWRTLCARRGTYTLPGGRSFTLDDEGTVSLAVTSRAGAGPAAMMYLHQSILRWTGWSLVAPPPGRPVAEKKGREPEPGTPALPGFSATFAPQPGTLPALRFGRGYRFQLRMVDVAGHADALVPGSTDFSRAVPGPSSPPAKYLRFQPVIAPVLVPTAPMTEGESVETMVIRPEPGLPGLLSSLLAPVLGTPPVRHVAPPKVGELLCEEHGMVDNAAGAPDAAMYSMLASRDKADLTGVGTPDPRHPNQRYVGGLSLPVTWLADPISRGAAIAGLPGGTVKIGFDPALLQSWPNVRSFRIQVVDGNGAPLWDPLLRLLSVFVPQGETRRARLSSFLGDGDLATLGHLGWLVDSGAAPSAVAAVKADLVAGKAWQVTPFRSLALVNAVKVPVEAPALVSITQASRTAGSTTQVLTASASVHRPSTGQLSLVATATEPVDDPDNPAGPSTVVVTSSPTLAPPGGAQGGMLSVGYDAGPVAGEQVPFTATHVLGDTRRHKVTYSLVATTRYMEHFVQRGAVTLTATTAAQVSKMGIVAGSDIVRTTDGATTFRRVVDYVVDEAAGTVARTPSSAIPSGSQVEVAIVAPPVTRSGSGVTRDLPSTARPAPPKVAWIVPTFGWGETSSLLGLQRTRTRAGGGLRIFLERPWYSSGIGEQLAVVLADGAVDLLDDQLQALVTQLGGDPVVKTALPGRFPVAAQFPLAKEPRPGLVPPELADRAPGVARTVAIAAHDVEWDAERQRWACDIVLPPGLVYQPFVRLAVARYQPISLGGVELSAVAPVEWAQLGPDRSATVVLDALDLTKVTLTVVGRSGGGTAAAPGQPNAVSVRVQTSAASNPGDLDWSTSGPADGQRLSSTLQADGTTTWTGVLRLPKARLLSPFRLVITEHEQFAGGNRLVYSDVVRL